VTSSIFNLAELWRQVENFTRKALGGELLGGWMGGCGLVVYLVDGGGAGGLG
jgi:hypothetical protein